jgi:hypothetical protein
VQVNLETQFALESNQSGTNRMTLRNLGPMAIVGADCACSLRRAKTLSLSAALLPYSHLQLNHTRYF